MAFIEIGNEGELNGTTPVTIVDAPSSGRRLVKSISIYNADSAACEVTITKEKTATGSFPLRKVTINAGDTLLYEHLIILDAADETISVVLTSAVAANNPVFDVAYGDAS